MTDLPTITAEIFLMVDQDGDYIATHDEDSLGEVWDNYMGGSPTGPKTVKLNLVALLPANTEVSGEIVPYQVDGEIALTVEA
jgi:hypothetical protein